MAKNPLTTNKQYKELLRSLKQKVVQSQHRAAMSVNSRLIYLYWQIGLHILHEQDRQGWGAKVIEQLAQDLSRDFPDMQGLSSRNMVYMRQFANEWPVRVMTQQLAAQLEQENTEFTQQGVAQKLI